MKKYLWFFLLIGILAVGGTIYFYNSNSKSGSNYNAEKSNFNNISNTNTQSDFNTSNPIYNHTKKTTVEKEIASYSTKIQNKKDKNRQSNITITCSSLNDTIVKSGETFSFCDTVGPSTEERGYKKANVIIQGTETKGLGGGNCQVSSTLYNAVLSIPNELEVIERHPHSAPVPYIKEGKDAAISYGSHDFKFKNNTNSDIKIIASNTVDNINIKIIKLIKE